MDGGGSISNPEDPRARDPIRDLLRHVTWRAAAPYLVVGVALLVAAVSVGSEIERHVAAIESWIESMGPWGWLAFVGLFVVASSLLVPDSVLCVLAGALFDLKWAITAAIVGLFVSSAIQFELSHRLLRPRIQRMLVKRPALAEIQRAVVRDELHLQVLLRLTPLNPATLNYILGAVGVRFSGFLIGCLALIPALVIEVYVGHAGRHFAQVAGGSVPASRLHDAMLIGGVVVCVVVFVIVSRRARQAVAQAVARIEAADGDLANNTE